MPHCASNTITRCPAQAALLAALAFAATASGQSRTPEQDIGATLARARATNAEMRWRSIPWRTSLKVALTEARKIKKPVFFFGYDGTLDDGNS